MDEILVIELYSLIKIIERVNEHKNFKLWLNVFKIFDQNFNLEEIKFLSNPFIGLYYL